MDGRFYHGGTESKEKKEWNVEALAEIPLRREWKTESQATAWRNVCRISGHCRILRCSAPEQKMELLVLFDQVEIKLAVYNFVEL